MAKELLLYSGIYNFVAENIIRALEEFESEKVTIRINSGGGDLQASWGIAAKMKEHGDVNVKVDGMAMSAAFNLCMYAKNAECLDISNFMAHRAAYTYGGESAEEKAFLAKVNADLRKQMESKIDSEKLKEMKGVTIADIFEKEERIMVFFTAAEAKKLGIVSKVTKLTPEEVEAFNETFMRIAAEHNPPTVPPQTNTAMTVDELKSKHPDVYNSIIAIGEKIGADREFDRCNAAMVFAHLDPEGVKKIIKERQPMTQTQLAEFTLKAMSPENLAKIAADKAKPVKTDPVNPAAGDDKKKEVDAFEKEIRSDLGLDKDEPGAIEQSSAKGVTLVTEKK